MSIKETVAMAMFLETRKDETVDLLAKTIADSFCLLINTEPLVALSVLEQLNDQFDAEKAEEINTSIQESIQEVASKVNIDSEELDH